jgi:glutamine synthetase
VSWGYENRTSAIRIPAGSPAARRIEHRVAGGDVNPYLMLAAILGAALDGIERELEPASPVVGNAYAVESLPQIATGWQAAIDALEQSTIVPRFLHPELIKNLISTKRQELHYLNDLSDAEKIELYLDTV